MGSKNLEIGYTIYKFKCSGEDMLINRNKTIVLNKTAKLGVLLGTTAFLTAYSLPAYAQVDEIVVTARKVEESLQDVPVAVTAFTGEFLQNSGLVEFSDISKVTPNFDIREDGVSGSGFSVITIRGQTALNRELSSDQAVGITINGAPITRGTNLFSNLFDVDQVEVLKGPQGTLFGKNTTGGAVIVTTTAPKLDTFEGYVEVDIGNFGRNDYEGVFNVGGENWAIRLGAASQSRDGFQFGVQRAFDPTIAGFPSTPTLDGVTTETGDDFADDDEIFYRAGLLLEPTDALSVRINADYHETDEAIQGVRVLNIGALDLGGLFFPIAVPTDPEFGFFAASQQLGTEPSLEADEFNINATVKYDFGAVALESITSYREQNAAVENPFATVAVNIGQDSDIFAQELRLSGNAVDDRLSWQVGGFYSNEEGEDQDDVGGFRTTASENETIAVFGQGTFDITEQLSFTGGLRWTDESRSVALVTENRPDGSFISVPPQEVSFDAISWTAGLDYKVTDDSLVYATISRGFRSGGIDDERLNLVGVEPPIGPDGNPVILTADDITVRPEFVLNYEVGLKADFLDNTVRWNSAAFFSDYTDIQVQTFDPVLVDANNQAVVTIANGAEAEIYGFETELTYVPNDNLSLGGTVGYTKADFQEFIFEDPASGLTIDRSEDAIGGPEWQASAFARYEDDISDGIRAGAQLNYTFRGTERLADGNDIPTFVAAGVGDQIDLDSYGLFNGQVDFDLEKLGANVAFYARNIFDNEIDTSGFAIIAFGQPLAQRNAGAPRTYGVRVRKSF